MGLRTEVRCSFEGYKDVLTKQSSQILEYKTQSNVEFARRLLNAEKRLRKLEHNLDQVAQDVMSSSSASSGLHEIPMLGSEANNEVEGGVVHHGKQARKTAERAAAEEAHRSLQRKLQAKAHE